MSIQVVIATDGSDEAIGGAARSLALIPPDADIRLVTVIDERHDPSEDAGGFEGPLLTEEEADADYAAERAAAAEAIERTERRLGGRVVTEQILPTSAPVARALAELAEAEGIDLLVVGGDRVGWLERLLHGAVDEQLVRRAPCPVLVMNHPAGTEAGAGPAGRMGG